MKSDVVRSPLFYVGDKYKLISEIKQYFPLNIRQFAEPFVGGGSVFMNVDAEKYYLNDIDKNIIEIHKMLCEFADKRTCFFQLVDDTVKQYDLSYSFKEDIIPEELKKQFVKTYYARFNKEGYDKMRHDYNISNEKSTFLLYMLLIYGFNRMIRFNKSGNFNLPVGNVDFNTNTANALENYFTLVIKKQPSWYNLDFEEFIRRLNLNEQDLIYLDPPYLITFSEYNKLWNEATEQRLLNLLDSLHQQRIKFAISNVTHYKGKTNDLFINWANQYVIHPIRSNYISYHDNTTKSFNEVLVTNY